MSTDTNTLLKWGAQIKARRAARKEAQVIKRDERAAKKRERAVVKQQARVERRLKSGLGRELRGTGRRIRESATALGVCHIRRSGRKAGTVAEIRYSEAWATPAFLAYRLRTPLPFRTNSDMIAVQETIQDIAYHVGAPVRLERSERNGIWLVVERSGLASIPMWVEYTNVFPQMPASAGPLDFPLGLGANNRFHHIDLTDLPHLLVAGATGGGKSVFLHNVLCTYAQRTTPKQMQLVLIDLKGGVELGVYEGLPHLYEFPHDDDLKPGIYGREDIADVFAAVQREVQRRLQMFRRDGVRRIERWNARHRGPRHLPYLVVVVDEIANAMLVSRIKNKIESLIADIGAQGRAAGIHMIIATQHPTVNVVTSLLNANIPGRIAFSTSTLSGSTVILGNKAAWGIGPAGRFVLRYENRPLRQIQAPFLSESLVDDILAAVAQGKTAENFLPQELTSQMVCEWCIEQDAGHFVQMTVYKHFNPRTNVTFAEVSRMQAEMVTSGRVFWYEDHPYQLRNTRRNEHVFVQLNADEVEREE